MLRGIRLGCAPVGSHVSPGLKGTYLYRDYVEHSSPMRIILLICCTLRLT